MLAERAAIGGRTIAIPAPLRAFVFQPECVGVTAFGNALQCVTVVPRQGDAAVPVIGGSAREGGGSSQFAQLVVGQHEVIAVSPGRQSQL